MPPSAPSGKKKLLIIDDDPQFTELLVATIESKADLDIRVENDSRQGLATALVFQPDLILLDVVMPDVDGGDLHSRLHSDPRLKDVPIVFLTSMVQQEEVDSRGGMIGGQRYLAKPVNLPQLMHVLDSIPRL